MARQLKDFIQSYMQYSSYSEAPDKFHFWTAVSTIAGALQRKVWFDCGNFDWVPNFYIIFVAPPGVVSKTTTFNIGMRLLRKVPKIKFGPDCCTWQVFVQELAGVKVGVQMPDGSIFKHSSMTVAVGELGTFLDPRNPELVDTLVSLWDGQRGTWRKSTKNSGEDVIENPWINLIGGTTPAWIQSSFPEYMVGGGFTSRTIFVYAEQKRSLIAYPHRTTPDINKELEAKLLHDLTEISKLAGKFTITEEAMDFGTMWYEDFMTNRPAHLDNDRFEGYIARKQTHVHKIAMILSVSEGDSLEITAEHLQKAIALTTALEADMPKVFSRIGVSRSGKNTSLLRKLLRVHGKVNIKTLYAMVFRQMSYEEFTGQVQNLREAGFCTQAQEGNVVFLIPTKNTSSDDEPGYSKLAAEEQPTSPSPPKE